MSIPLKYNRDIRRCRICTAARRVCGSPFRCLLNLCCRAETGDMSPCTTKAPLLHDRGMHRICLQNRRTFPRCLRRICVPYQARSKNRGRTKVSGRERCCSPRRCSLYHRRRGRSSRAEGLLSVHSDKALKGARDLLSRIRFFLQNKARRPCRR